MDPELRLLGAHGALASNCADEAIALVGDSADPALLRIASRAHIERDRWQEAGALAAHESLRDDDEARSVVRVARAAAGRELWGVIGAGCADAPLRSDADVPIIEITIDGTDVLALIDLSNHVTLVSPEVAEDGLLEEVRFGSIGITHVPVFSRDLSRECAVAGIAVDAVLGRDLLFRWSVTFGDGLVRLGGPGWRHSASDMMVIDGMPAVVPFQTHSSDGHSRSIGAFAIDTTSRRAFTIVERALSQLPFGWEVIMDGSSVRVPGLNIGGWMSDAEMLLESERAPPLQGTIGWPYLASGARLSWGMIEAPIFFTRPDLAVRPDVLAAAAERARAAEAETGAIIGMPMAVSAQAAECINSLSPGPRAATSCAASWR